jgi:hypothetical protein
MFPLKKETTNNSRIKEYQEIFEKLTIEKFKKEIISRYKYISDNETKTIIKNFISQAYEV